MSPAEMHDSLRTVIVAPMTTGSHPAPYRIPVTLNNKDGLILIDQIRTLDKVRLVKKVGEVNAKVLTATLTILQEAFTD